MVMRPYSMEATMLNAVAAWAIPLLLSPLGLIISPAFAPAQTPIPPIADKPIANAAEQTSDQPIPPANTSPPLAPQTRPPQLPTTAEGTTRRIELPQPVVVPNGADPKVADQNGAGPKGADNGNVQQIVIPLSGEVRKRIEDALRKPTKDQRGNPLPPTSTGDPILDDVLQVIRNRGSVLDGSSLDPQTDLEAAPQPPATGRTARPAPPRPLPRARIEEFPDPQTYPAEPLSGYPAAPRYGSSDAGQPRPDSRFVAAEALLRAARLLADVPATDEGTAALIGAMRERAAMLLIDQFTPNPNRLENAP
jgi:hypothetical protein